MPCSVGARAMCAQCSITVCYRFVAHFQSNLSSLYWSQLTAPYTTLAASCPPIGEMWLTPNGGASWTQVPLSGNGFGKESNCECDGFTSAQGVASIIVSGGRIAGTANYETNGVYIGYGNPLGVPQSGAASLRASAAALTGAAALLSLTLLLL